MSPTKFAKDLAPTLRATGLLCLLIAGTVSAHATTITVNLDSGYPSNYIFYTYTGASGNASTLPVAPYRANVSGGQYHAGQSYYLWCYDINVDTNVGVNYAGSVQAPTTVAEIEAAYLENRVFQLGGYGASAAVVGPYALAVWELMNPTSINPAAFDRDPAAHALIVEAQQAYLSGAWTQSDANRYAVWTPDNLGSSQRFGLIATPEPASFGLMGLGLLAAYAKRRRSAR